MHNQDEYVVEVVNWTLNTYKFIENQIFYVENEHRRGWHYTWWIDLCEGMYLTFWHAYLKGVDFHLRKKELELGAFPSF